MTVSGQNMGGMGQVQVWVSWRTFSARPDSTAVCCQVLFQGDWRGCGSNTIFPSHCSYLPTTLLLTILWETEFSQHFHQHVWIPCDVPDTSALGEKRWKSIVLDPDKPAYWKARQKGNTTLTELWEKLGREHHGHRWRGQRRCGSVGVSQLHVEHFLVGPSGWGFVAGKPKLNHQTKQKGSPTNSHCAMEIQDFYLFPF